MWTRSGALKQYRVYQPPEGETGEWRLGFLESLPELKGDNWSVTFNEEEDEEEELHNISVSSTTILHTTQYFSINLTITHLYMIFVSI